MQSKLDQNSTNRGILAGEKSKKSTKEVKKVSKKVGKDSDKKALDKGFIERWF